MIDSSQFSELVARRYRLTDRIGRGNMSSVFKGVDTRRGNYHVAVKLLNTQHEDDLKLEVFRRETKALSQLEHPNIVSVLDQGWSSEYHCHYIVFKYIPRTLLEVIAAHAHDRDQVWCWSLMQHMTDALVHAHSQGVIHRDIKPSNILITDDGQATLVDFGVSLLRFELARELTVSSFFSVGYASPEQRRGEQATERSDIYALGCVFYHMLSRRAPPLEGFLAPEDIGALPVFEQIKQILSRMLAPNPGERFPDAAQLRRRLEVTHRLELLPEVYLLVTDRARRDLFDQGYLDEASTDAACSYLLQELGEDDPKAVHLSLDRGGELRLYTDTLRLVCVRDATLPALVIKAIHTPYQPQIEQEKSRTPSHRFLWQVSGTGALTSLPNALFRPLNTTLTSLFEQLAVQKAERQTDHAQSVERKDLTSTWGSVLSFQQERLEHAQKLSYQYVTTVGDTLLFQLQAPAPDILSWPENAPLAVMDPDKPYNGVFVGHLMSVSGKTLLVSRDHGEAHTSVSPTDRLPASGLVGMFQQEAKVALNRQQAALQMLRDGTTRNPRLAEVLLDLSLAEFDSHDTNITFFQPDLAEDKRQAVLQALAARDIFLLQGPPGTGKTTTLAEIILQILVLHPDARILVSSQSNVAVNHILSRLAELQGAHTIEIVRIGRSEKIGHGAQLWTIDQRLEHWREEVLARTDGVIATLKASLREQRQSSRAQQLYSPSVMEDVEQCLSWLEELTEEVEELELLEDGEQLKKRESLDSSLSLIRETLPEDVQGRALPSLSAELQRLITVAGALLRPGPFDPSVRAKLDLVTRWRKIFGKQEDFARPILERATILAATCLISGGYYLKDQFFDYAIIDEAGRATAPELLIPLVRSRRAIIVGDERQLPPMLDEDLSHKDLERLGTSREHLGESLFSTLVAQGKDTPLPAVRMLTQQHRMHPAIGRMISVVFYKGQLTHAVNAQEREHRLAWLKRPVVWFSTEKLERRGETHQGTSFYNRAEVQAISQLLHRMERSYRELGQHREVAIITPYSAQIAELIAELTPDSPFWQALSLEVAVIDGFQGRDRDIVLYSTVRSNHSGVLGFLRDRRRLNVALSRARQALLIVGDSATLERGKAGSEGNPYMELIRYMRNHPEDCLIEDMEEGHHE